MKFNKTLLAATLLLPQLLPTRTDAFALLEPPASGYTMNLNLSTAQFQSLGYGLTSLNQLAKDALARWNAVGIGSGPDHEFFRTTNPLVVGNACARDGVNEVTWASSNCGFAYGSAIAITNRWLVNGVRVEEDVIFNSTVPYNAYQGPFAPTGIGGAVLNDFFRVAVHEFGHAAGLDHPNEHGQQVTAIMNSQISEVDSIQPDDIAGAHAILWSATSPTTTTTVSATTTTTLGAPGHISMQNYFPFRPGYQWTYQKAGAVVGDKRVVGQTPVVVNGVSTYVWADTSGVSRFMTNDASGIRRHAVGSPYLPGFCNTVVTRIFNPPELYATATVVLGSSDSQTGTLVDTCSDGASRTAVYTQTNSYDAESVTVPAGSFATIRVTNVRTTDGVVTTDTYWVADGVGIVKRNFPDGNGGEQTLSLLSINFTPAPGAATLNLAAGWNLVGKSAHGALDVAATFGNPDQVVSVWKWIANRARWAFYTPSLAGLALTDYAGGKGYDVLTTINGGDGFWVNARSPFAVQLPAGAPVASASFQGIGPEWHLLAIGDYKTPREFNRALGLTPPAPGAIPANITTLWTWDASNGGWYFYAPSLDANGTLPNYIATKGYLDFGTKVLDPVSGFWVNVP